MDPIEKLMAEHRVIESALDAMLGYVTAVGTDDPAPRSDLERFVTFIREYADAYHHGKEEDMLFTAMVERGMSTESGPIAVMLAEHEQGRAHVATLREVSAGEGPIAPAEATEIAGAGVGYVELLRGHIMKEDQILYPMALQILPGDAVAALSARFEAYEEEHEAAALRLADVARELHATYAV
jgi:hemerythrin-like domain-containing protein